jgi:hypothetical protein
VLVDGDGHAEQVADAAQVNGGGDGAALEVPDVEAGDRVGEDHLAGFEGAEDRPERPADPAMTGGAVGTGQAGGTGQADGMGQAGGMGWLGGLGRPAGRWSGP